MNDPIDAKSLIADSLAKARCSETHLTVDRLREAREALYDPKISLLNQGIQFKIGDISFTIFANSTDLYDHWKEILPAIRLHLRTLERITKYDSRENNENDLEDEREFTKEIDGENHYTLTVKTIQLRMDFNKLKAEFETLKSNLLDKCVNEFSQFIDKTRIEK